LGVLRILQTFGALAVQTRLPHACLAIVILWLVGCSSEPQFSEEPVKANLRTIGKAYWMIAGYHNRPPKDAEELQSSLTDIHNLEMGGPPAEVLVSPRDGEPFVIILKARPNEDSGAIFAYEKKGADNSRWVITMGGDIKNIPNEEFSKQTFAGGHKPDA
jgi:hypothetical protein